MDQKPAWFNNAGSQGTYSKRGGRPENIVGNFAHTRSRYTIFTSVDSASTYNEHSTVDPPMVFVLFKGKPGGRILDKIHEQWVCPPWMKIQVQENGSYREEDVLDSLREILPVAATPLDSIVVLLDWFSAHRTEAVINFIQRRGHVVLFHGGGITGFTQVNDTHLHALLQRLLIMLENRTALVARKDMHLNHQKGIPTLHRHQICDLVATAWRSMPHAAIARRGYEQTGPFLPSTGPIRRDQVARDLRGVFDDIDAPIGTQEVGEKIRDDAKAFVDKGFGVKWRYWSDAPNLLEEHDDEDDPIPEGLEAFGYAVGDSEEDESSPSEGHPGGDSSDDGEPSGRGGGGGSGGEIVPAHADDDVSGDVASGGGEAATASANGESGRDPGLSCPAASDASADFGVAAASSSDFSLERAREIMIADARKSGNEVLLRHLFAQRAGATRDQAERSTAAAKILQKRALEQQLEEAVARKRAKQEEELARRDVEAAALRKVEAESRRDALRLDAMRETMRFHREEVARKQEERVFKSTQRWLQTVYPRDLAVRLRSICARRGADYAATMIGCIREAKAQNFFTRNLYVRELWVVDVSFLVRYAQMRPPGGGHPRTVYCGAPLSDVLGEVAPPPLAGGIDPVMALQTLFDACVPGSGRQLFRPAHSLPKLLHQNDYVMDKAFVHGIYYLSRCLGRRYFAAGIHCEWPPKPPAEAVPAQPLGPPLDEVPVCLPPVPPVGALPALVDAGFPAMSSAGEL